MDNRTLLLNAYNENRAEWKSADANPYMIYVKHDLSHNYMSANGSGDAKMKTDIVLSEIGRLIVYSPGTVVGILNKYKKKKLDGIPSQNELVRLVSAAIHNSRKFTEDFSIEIIKQSGEMSFDATPSKPMDIAGLLGGASGVISGLGNLFGGKAKAEAATETAKANALAAQANAQAALANATAGVAGGKIKSNIGLYIGIGVGVAALGGFAIWYFKLKNNKL